MLPGKGGGSVGALQESGHKQTTKEKLAQEFKRRVTSMVDGPVGSKAREKYLLEWTSELRKVAQEEERKLEAGETKKLGQEDSFAKWEPRTRFPPLPWGARNSYALT